MVSLHRRVSCGQRSCSRNNNNYNNNDSAKQRSDKSSRTHSASASSSKRRRPNLLFTLGVTFGVRCFLLTLTSVAGGAEGAAVYSNFDLPLNPHFEPVCSQKQEHFIESDGKASSLILEFNPGVLAEKRKSCTRILSAPSNYGFIVRLILPKIRRGHLHGKSSASSERNEASAPPMKPKIAPSALKEMTTLMEKLNATALKSPLGRTCPLSIFSSLDPHTPQWRVDPCQLEDTAPEMEDPVRLFHGRVRIVWEHGHNLLKSKLMLTALGKGDQCRGEDKHQCLKIGDEPILCISKDLVCDGIRHCPSSNEYDSDEDYAMCWQRRRFGEPMPPAMETDIFEHFAMEVFRNLFAFDVATTTTTTTTAATTKAIDANTPAPLAPTLPPNALGGNSTTLRKVESTEMQASSIGDGGGGGNGNGTATPPSNGTESSASSGPHRNNATRKGVGGDLSKYGPWGYLMLGMLLCGGALLICGLWASASQSAANSEREAAMQQAGHTLDHQSSTAAPPNYEELDPPPAYSVLFPNQKAASSATLSSLAGSSTAAAAAIAIPAATDAGATTTRAQLEAVPAASGSSSQRTQAP